MTDYNNIPIELQQHEQWVCWSAEIVDGKPTKVPKCPFRECNIDITNPANLCSFQTAVGNAHKFSGIGFVLLETDPFCFIDLDATDDLDLHNRHVGILEAFDSYTEFSPSGQGLHIIVKGTTPTGRKKFKTEIYSKSRFMTMTGNIYYNKPIAERQELVNQLWSELKPKSENASVWDGEDTEVFSDDEIIDMIISASNGDKATKLASGQWEDEYASRSEADQALMNIIAFYTDHKKQAIRIFRNTELGKRDKCNRDDYMKWTVDLAFDRKVPTIDFQVLNKRFEELDQQTKDIFKPTEEVVNVTNFYNKCVEYFKEQARLIAQGAMGPLKIEPGVIERNPNSDSDRLKQHETIFHDDTNYEWPPGFVGELAKYIFQNATMPVKELAVFSAITVVMGLVARSYNYSSAGLNQYMLMVAKTGRGKDMVTEAVDRIYNKLDKDVLGIREMKALGKFASAQALTKCLSKSPSLLFVVGEYGMELRKMTSAYAKEHQIGILQMLLAIYSKSHKNGIFDGITYSDKDKNVQAISAPCLSVVGETAPNALYQAMGESQVQSGLIPRFLIMHYTGQRVKRNKKAWTQEMPTHLYEHLKTLATGSLHLNNANACIDVEEDEIADSLLDDFEDYCTDVINKEKYGDSMSEIWNRAHLKVLKMAALLAVADNPYKPIIGYHHARWAIDIISKETHRLSRKFMAGETGDPTNELNQRRVLIRALRSWLMNPACKYNQPEFLVDKKIIPHRYVVALCSQSPAFSNASYGATRAIKNVLQEMIDGGDIAYLTVDDKKALGVDMRSKLYKIINIDFYKEIMHSVVKAEYA